MNRIRLGFASDLQKLLDYLSRVGQWPDDAVELCDKVANLWMSVTNEKDIHVTVKFLEEQNMVVTAARSTCGMRGRPLSYGEQSGEEVQKVPVGGSTAFESVTGSSPLMCFCARDLPAHGERKYKNNRPAFTNYLKAAVVFPIYVPGKLKPMGFLTFDSIDAKGFRSLPNYLETNDSASYNSHLERSAAFHLGRGLARVVGDLWWRKFGDLK